MTDWEVIVLFGCLISPITTGSVALILLEVERWNFKRLMRRLLLASLLNKIQEDFDTQVLNGKDSIKPSDIKLSIPRDDYPAERLEDDVRIKEKEGALLHEAWEVGFKAKAKKQIADLKKEYFEKWGEQPV